MENEILVAKTVVFDENVPLEYEFDEESIEKDMRGEDNERK